MWFTSVADAIEVMKKYIKEYCVGCGLCQAVEKATLKKDSKGFSYPQADNCDDLWFDNVCPDGGAQQDRRLGNIAERLL